MRLDPTPNTVKRIFALSGNQCAFTGCTRSLVDEHGNLFAEICHIEAAEPNGERYNPQQTDEERRSFENLILMCANHHIETNNIQIWHVEKLKKLKEDHEQKFLKTPFTVPDKIVQQTILKDYLEGVEIDLDKGCPNLAISTLTRIKSAVEAFGGNDLGLKFGLLHARASRAIGPAKEAESIHSALAKTYPADPRPLLYLAELELNKKDFEKNQKLLDQAEAIDPNYWLLGVEKIIRALRLSEPINTKDIDESTFGSDMRIRSILYFIYAICFEVNREHDKADQFLEKAIKSNPNRLINYSKKAYFMNNRLSNKQVFAVADEQKIEVLNTANEAIEKAELWKSDNPKDMIALLTNKINPLAALGKFAELQQLFDKLFDLCLRCSFDTTVEEALLSLLSRPLVDANLDKLLNYLVSEKVEHNDVLIKTLIYQFSSTKEILKKGKAFFEKHNIEPALDFIKALEEEDIKKVIYFIGGDLRYMQALSMALKDFPKIRQALIDELKKNSDLNWETSLMLFYYENGEDNKAFEILSEIDISTLVASQCEMCTHIARNVGALDKELEILERWLVLEEDEKSKLHIQLDLFAANFRLGNFPQANQIGKALLSNALLPEMMDQKNMEGLLAQTILCHTQRGEYDKGLELLKKHSDIPHSFQFKTGLQAELYFRCGDKDGAIESVIEGVKTLNYPSPEQYGMLFWHLIQIGEKDGFSLDSNEEVEKDYFVKLKDEERWFCVGNNKPLDAVGISQDDAKYDILINKKVGDEVQFPGDKYAEGDKKRVIEVILPLERYVFWKARQCFTDLSKSGWEMGQLVEVPTKDGKTDFSKLLAFMGDAHKSDKEFFEKYCSENFPIAILAYQQGGLLNAIGKIAQERKGFIRLSDGTHKENVRQEKVADTILGGKEVYLDATSALFLSETGLLEKVKSHIPSLKVPQSVINYLFGALEKFRITPGTAGRMGYADGKLTYNQIVQGESDIVRSNIKKSIHLLEAEEGVVVTSPQSKKADVWSEEQMPAELSDACVLAQDKKVAIITDDYLQLHVNALETKKEIPEYCSSITLMRKLLDKGLISFNDYLDYFGYLSSYRCRFLGLSANDLLRATLGDGKLVVIQPENLRKFNLPLVLSEEYGVPLITAVKVVAEFLTKIITDDSIATEVSNKIFAEAIEGFLQGRKSDKREAGTLLLQLCRQQVAIIQKKAPILIPTRLKDEKLNSLDRQIDLSASDNLIL